MSKVGSGGRHGIEVSNSYDHGKVAIGGTVAVGIPIHQRLKMDAVCKTGINDAPSNLLVAPASCRKCQAPGSRCQAAHLCSSCDSNIHKLGNEGRFDKAIRQHTKHIHLAAFHQRHRVPRRGPKVV